MKKRTIIKHLHSFSSKYYLNIMHIYQFCVRSPQIIKSGTSNIIILRSIQILIHPWKNKINSIQSITELSVFLDLSSTLKQNQFMIKFVFIS